MFVRVSDILYAGHFTKGATKLINMNLVISMENCPAKVDGSLIHIIDLIFVGDKNLRISDDFGELKEYLKTNSLKL